MIKSFHAFFKWYPTACLLLEEYIICWKPFRYDSFTFLQDLSPTHSLAWCVQVPAKSTQTFTTAWMLWKRCRFQKSSHTQSPDWFETIRTWDVFTPGVSLFNDSFLSIFAATTYSSAFPFGYTAETTWLLPFLKIAWVTPHIRLTNPTLTLTLLQ